MRVKAIVAFSLAFITSLAMFLFCQPLKSFADEIAQDNQSQVVEISKKTYALAPGVTEYELITNNRELSKQQVGHIMEVTPGSSAELRIGYGDYNIDAIASGSNWAMTAPTEQAKNAEVAAKIDVVGIVNGDFFNMANGCPSGFTVMQGKVVRNVNSATFWIDNNGGAHISGSRTEVDSVCAAQGITVREAIGGGAILIKDGERTTSGSSYGDIANPRTVVGIKADGTVIIYMVDGRQAPYSVGMTYGDLADILFKLDCVQAINIDGGGSSAFATQREGEPNDNGKGGLTMRARPSDGYERKVSTTLMVVSTAKADGEFDHATITPDQEIYTPGSTIAFNAIGVDKAGRLADLPAEGLSWTVISGSELGSIDNNGVFTGKENKEGSAEVALLCNGERIGTAKIQLRWPDKLDFTNSSVSLDFGESSDLTFNPTYKGQTVRYKDGDFVWGLNENGLTYKYSVQLEQYYTPWWQAAAYRWSQLSLLLTGKTAADGTADLTYYYEEKFLYSSKYHVDREIYVSDDGSLSVRNVLTHRGAKLYSYDDGSVLLDNITEDLAQTTISGKAYGIRGIKPTQEVTFSLGAFRDNIFTADENTSLRGTVNVALKGNSAVSGSIDLVVGMEPLVLMDFEDYTAPDGTVISAADYWKTKVSQGSTGQLSPSDVHDYRLWVRAASNKGAVFPTDNGQNSIVSAEDDPNVRFGQYAFKMGYDFTAVASTNVAVAEFGFSGDMYINAVQPTKIGVWINVPEDRKNDNSVLKAVLKGGAVEAATDTAYIILNEDGSMSYKDGYQLTGTASYVTYYSYNADGTVSGEKLADWAGKGWIWVEADISNFQMPVDLCRGYTVRITSPQNCTKDKGFIYLDNLQFIYGTNTNDINNPVIEGITELNGRTALQQNGTTEITNGAVSFEVLYNDSESTDKYASGVDTGSVRIYIDGVDYTAQAEITAKTLILPSVTLNNGDHTVRVVVKDFYGNLTETTRTITVNDDAGEDALVGLEPQEDAPQINKSYNIDIVSKTGQPVESADISLKLYEKYLDLVDIVPGAGYVVSMDKDTINKLINIGITKDPAATSFGRVMASVSVAIPSNETKEGMLVFSVPSGRYVEAGGTATFSVAERTIALTAAYTAQATAAVKRYPVTVTVKDSAGNPVSGASVMCDDALIGTTDSDGCLVYTFDASTVSAHVMYAIDADGGRSWNINVPVCDWATDGNGLPFGIQNNANAAASTTATITWMSAIGLSGDYGAIRYAENANNVASAAETRVQRKIIAFAGANGGDAMWLNTAELTGLKPATTYYYMVGCGEKWSDVLSFTTASADPNALTEFVVMGDIQTESTSSLKAVLDSIKGENYSFAIQTGDAIDNVNSFSNWRALSTVLNAGSLGVPMVHTLGNHEYYGAADGEVSSDIFSLIDGAQGAYYSVEYGSVYVGVINNGGDLGAALNKMKEDAKKSDCQWKILVMHEPVYGTTETMAEAKLNMVTAAVQEAGIEFVFGGDHHSYARTYPMYDNVALDEDNVDGVVYFVSGDLSSKTNEFNKYDYHAKAIGHVDYDGCYLSVKADRASFTVRAVKYDGQILDVYTKNRTDCQLGKHTVNGESVYNIADKTVSCSICGAYVDSVGFAYSGLLDTTDGKQVILTSGKPVTDSFTMMGELMYHSDNAGYAHTVVINDPTSCIKGGRKSYECKICNASEAIGDWIMPTGHDWNDAHVCNKCGFAGVDINTLETGFLINGVERGSGMLYFYYQASGVRPGLYVKHNGSYLTWSNDATLNSDGTMRDLYVSWSNDRSVGVAKLNIEGKGNYYGERSLDYTILPNDVKDLQVADVEMNAVTLKWTAAAGAGYYRLYECDVNGKIKSSIALDIKDTSYRVGGLKTDTTYYFKIAASAKVDGDVFNCSKWSNILTVKTLPLSDGYTVITGIRSVVNGRTINAYFGDEGTYIFLPADANVSALDINFVVKKGPSDAILVSGGSSAKYVYAKDEYSGTINLNEHATLNPDGSYVLSVKYGDYSPITVTVMKAEEIPTIYLTSNDPVSQGRNWVDASKENHAIGAMAMVKSDGTSVYNGALGQIKARGNSTFAWYPKKAYQIKLSAASDLLGNGEKVKTWVLLANYGDATMMHDKFFKDLAAETGMDYTASSNWVNLYYDGEYRGVYLLSEKNSVNASSVDVKDLEAVYEELNPGYGTNMTVKRGTNKYGMDICYTDGLTDPEDISGGYLIELNHSMWDEVNGFKTAKGVAFNAKSPEWLSLSAMRYISEYYQAFENAVYAIDASGAYTGYNAEEGKYYYDYVDADSLVKIFLIQELGLNPDGYISSLYFYKDAGGKMYAGPVWDQDMTLGTGWSKYISSDITDYHYLANALIKIPDFKNRVIEYFRDEFKDLVKEKVAANGQIDRNYEVLKSNALMNYVLWDYVRVGDPNNENHIWQNATYQGVVADMKKWIEARLIVLENNFSKLDSVKSLVITSDKVINAVYGDEGAVITAVADPASSRISYKSTNTSVVTVENGKLTYTGVGTAEIIVSAGFKTERITVVVESSSLSLNYSELEMTENETVRLIAETQGALGAVYSSSDETVVTVDDQGNLVAVGEGTAVITVRLGKKTATCTVTVKAARSQDDSSSSKKYRFGCRGGVDASSAALACMAILACVIVASKKKN